MERRHIKTSLHLKSLYHLKYLTWFHCLVQYLGFDWNHTFPRWNNRWSITIPFLRFQSSSYDDHPSNLYMLYLCACMLWAPQKFPNKLCTIGCIYFQCQLHRGIYNPFLSTNYSCRSCMPHCCHGHGYCCLCCYNKIRFHCMRTNSVYIWFRVHCSRYFRCNIWIYVSSGLLLLRCRAFQFLLNIRYPNDRGRQEQKVLFRWG